MSELDGLHLLVPDADALARRTDKRAVAAYFGSLPKWPPPEPPGNVQGPQRPDADQHDSAGRTLSCTTTEYTMTTNPSQIVMFEPDLSCQWPGALVQGTGYSLGIGSLKELPIKKRAPLQVSVTLLIEPNTVTVARPDAATVNAAVAHLIKPIEGREDYGSNVYFNMHDTYSSEEAMLSLGISAKYARAEFKAKHSTISTRETKVITAAYIQNKFSVYVNNPKTPEALFSNDFTLADIRAQEQLDRLGKNNLPVIVMSVTYGRVLYATISSTNSFAEVKSALSASYDSGTGAGGAVEFGEKNKQILREVDIKMSAIGIEEQNAIDLIRSGKIQDFFKSKMDIRSVRPISWVFYNIRDLSIAGLTDRTKYAITVCRPKSTNPSADISARATSLEQNRADYVKWVAGASSNKDDPGRAAECRANYSAYHQRIVSSLDWLRTNGAGLSADDKAWLADWLPQFRGSIERDWNGWRHGFDTNPSDAWARFIYGDGMQLSGNQSNLVTAALKVIAPRPLANPKALAEEAGKKPLAGDTARTATSDEVKDLRRETGALKEVVAELTLETVCSKNA